MFTLSLSFRHHLEIHRNVLKCSKKVCYNFKLVKSLKLILGKNGNILSFLDIWVHRFLEKWLNSFTRNTDVISTRNFSNGVADII